MKLLLQSLATLALLAATAGLALVSFAAERAAMTDAPALSDPQPERWLLLLSGLAVAAWMARRRLGSL